MYEEILIPTDGNAGVKRAMRHGLGIAEKYDATVHTLYVVDTSYSFTGAWDSLGEALEDRGKEATRKVAEKCDERGIEVVRETKVGVPHKIILDYSKKHDIDMVVMGTHGKSRIGEVIIGSVTQRVVRKSDIPVLTVKMREKDVEDVENKKEKKEDMSEDVGDNRDTEENIEES